MRISSRLLLSIVAFSFTVGPALAQLPPTTWSKTVHTPGDNQYGGEQQTMRHPVFINTTPVNPNLRSSGPAAGGGGGGSTYYQKAPSAPKPDISLQPIPADEPVIPANFPPLPTGLDLPGVMATTAGTFNASYGGSSSGGGGGGGGLPSFNGKKQGYGHFQPGAFEKKASEGGRLSDDYDDSWKDEVRKPISKDVTYQQGYGRVAPGAYANFNRGGGGGGGGGGGDSSGYYKCREAPNQMRHDTFGSNDAPQAPSAPNFKGLGKEPKLSDFMNGGDTPTPSAPVPVELTQASTQDLSLPDDEFTKRKPPSRAGRYAGRYMNQMMKKGMMQGMRMMRF